MNAFLFKLKHYTGFIPIFFDSLVEIGRCAESTTENQEPTKEFDDFIQQYNVQPYRTGLNQAITSRMLDIKQIGLKYWEAFVTGRLQVILSIKQRKENNDFLLRQSIPCTNLLTRSKFGSHLSFTQKMN